MQLNSIIVDADEYQAMQNEIAELRLVVAAKKKVIADLNNYVDDLRHKVNYNNKQLVMLTSSYDEDDVCPVVKQRSL